MTRFWSWNISKKNLARIQKGLAPTPLEETECFNFVQWLDLLKIKYTHINNEMFTPSFKQKALSKKMGVKKWIPDYLIVIPAGLRNKPENKLIFIEMKNQEGGRKPPAQKAWIKLLHESEGVDAYFSNGWAEAKKIVESYFIYDT